MIMAAVLALSTNCTVAQAQSADSQYSQLLAKQLKKQYKNKLKELKKDIDGRYGLRCGRVLRGMSLLPGACCWTAAGPRPAAPTLKKCAATSSDCAPGCCPAPRTPPAKSCGCSRP